MENTAYPCPGCGAPADLIRGCSGCGRPPYPPAAEVVRLDREIVALGREVERARGAYQEASGRLLAAQRRRAELAARVRVEVPTRQAPASPVPRPVPAAPGRPEASTLTVQSLLFVFGGLLLGTAAMVFTAVAWAAVGVAGRALILAAFTALMLAVPLVAMRRGLRGTAETFAAVGLLLVVLDGYAAWSVNLFGAAGWPVTRYAALVGGASAAVAAGYARLSRLTVPWFAALLVAQPVLPLAAVAARPGATGWTLVLLGVALLDLGVVVALRGAAGARHGGSAAGGGPVADPRVGSTVAAGRVLAWLGFGVASALAACTALVPLAWGRAAGQPLLAGLPLLLVGLVLLGAARVAGGPFPQVAAGLLVPLLAAALLRPVAELSAGFLLLAAGVVSIGAAGAVRLLPTRFRSGPRVGALVVTGVLAQVGVLATALLAGGAAARSLPPWRGAAAGPELGWGWQLPITVALTAVAVTLLLPRAARPVATVVGVALTASALPAVAATPWPAALALDLLAGAGLLLTALRPGRRAPTALAGSLAGGVLLGHGLLVGLATSGGTLATLGVVLAVGLAAPVVARRGSAVQQRAAGLALVAGLLAVPAGTVVALHATGSPSWWQLRGALAAAGLLLGALLAVRRIRPDLDGYASTALAVALAGLAPVALVVPGREPVALYAALAALALAVADRGLVVGRVIGGGSAVLAVLAAAPVSVGALVSPYGGPVLPWAGVPATRPVPGAPAVAAALLVLAAAAALVARRAGGGR
ncbi:hypothetical protein V6U81_28745, partial [Micromonospora sp. CPCC 205711]